MKHSHFAYNSKQVPRRRRHAGLKAVLVVLLAGVIGGFIVYAHPYRKVATLASNGAAATSSNLASKPATTTTQPQTTAPPSAPSKCTGNSGQLIVVSISARHLWACSSTTVAYDSPVVTGMENLPADLTPTGTYHIYGKQTGLTLRGSDSTGSWNDPVSYWMPFLDNQYGAYGFHDATWRANSDFGNISPYSSSASHGCVELPLAAAKWLYNWAPIGTTVQIVA